MAKVTGFLRGARGRVGGHVFRKGENGATIMSEYQEQIKNPQTNLQTAQRIIFATVAQAAKFLKPIINHSFESTPYGNKSVRKFRKLNLRKLRNLCSQDFAEAVKGVDARVFMTTRNVQALIPNRYVISQGSLSPSGIAVRLASPITTTNNTGALRLETTPWSVSMYLYNGKIRIGDLIKQIFNITSNDEQITLVTINVTAEGFKYAFQDDPEMAGWAIPYTTMNARRLVVDAAADLNEMVTVTYSGNDVTNVSAILTKVMGIFDIDKSDMEWLSRLETYITEAWGEMKVYNNIFTISKQDAAKITINNLFDVDASSPIGCTLAAGVIRSRYNNGNWLRSNSEMLMTYPQPYDSEAPVQINFGLDWNTAPQAWWATQEVAEDDRFLNEGGSGGEVGENFNSPVVETADTLFWRRDDAVELLCARDGTLLVISAPMEGFSVESSCAVQKLRGLITLETDKANKSLEWGRISGTFSVNGDAPTSYTFEGKSYEFQGWANDEVAITPMPSTEWVQPGQSIVSITPNLPVLTDHSITVQFNEELTLQQVSNLIIRACDQWGNDLNMLLEPNANADGLVSPNSGNIVFNMTRSGSVLTLERTNNAGVIHILSIEM